MDPMAVTIKDVAREAGVSVATVSRALNGQPNVTAPVRARVLQVANDLRYSPHHAARALSSRRSHTIGVVLPDLHGEFFSELIRGIGQAARAHGLHLLLSSDHGDAGGQGAALLAMRGRVDGVLVMAPTDGGTRFLADYLAPTLPAVLINTRDPEGVRPWVGVDNNGGARAMVSHLVDAGRRRIAFIAGPVENHDARERLRGYRDQLAASLPDAIPMVVEGDFDEASGARAAASLLAQDPRPDAVFAANDAMAIGCLRAFVDAGVEVPGEIALAGFDDIPLARHVHPALTTMRVDIAELGACALRVLLQARSGGDAGDAGVEDDVRPIMPQLVVRGSSVRADAGARPRT
ncbi:LacI family DNA-binding transcriptional regulator [Luteimonas sp. MC1572]|uniref:LacI family DNA-binding transcriptional regulator n=1 Tax=Luteimonas sp. MC1572 TaxID=2799325 RepID=UPI0018F0D14D|nr:LacI family DNA-binding transcriptional regulator [Luteimonas sp. MC1572]MBJ6980717.1 LacI family DNA-binding transcriptional regulator [Luteimonas sp. MC1572]QQO04555.1 LacI family DNA-binding transcriptional regulator [Luteimonas sp. MC1572]